MARTLRSLALVAAGLSLLVGGRLPAAEEGPTPVGSLKDALARARAAGAPILVWVSLDNEAACNADHQVFRDPMVRKAMKGYLLVYANPLRDHGSADGTLDGKPAKVCKITGNTSCDAHMRAFEEVRNTYADVIVNKSGSACMPCHFVVGADGKVVGSINSGSVAAGFDVVQPAAMVKGLGQMLLKAGGPGLTDEQLEKARKAVAAARTSLDSGHPGEAARALAPVVALKKALEVVQDARELLKRVDRFAAERYAKAHADMKAGKVLQALDGFDRVATEFPGTDSAEAAAKAKETFLASPEGKKALADLKRSGEGREKLKKAAAIADAGGRDAEALRMLDEIAKSYAGLPPGEEAAERAAAIRADPERAKALAAEKAKREAASLLFAAKGLFDAGKKAEAVEKLKKLLAEYADTPAAEEARKLLEAAR